MNSCPFNCGYRSDSEYATRLHIENDHSEGSTSSTRGADLSSTQTSFSINDNPSNFMPEDMWTRCTRPGCGDYILIYDIDEHLDMHTAIILAETEEERPALPPRRRQERQESRPISTMTTPTPSPRRHTKVKSKSENTMPSNNSLLHYFAGTAPPRPRPNGRSSTTYRHIRDEPLKKPGRLGKRELGPYAFENVMPDEVRRALIEGSRPHLFNQIGRDGRVYRQTMFLNQTSGLIPILADLCASDRNTVATYLSHPATRHIHKLQCNGNFCGYWNIQVLLSYIQAVTPEGPQEIPNVLQIQAYIHQAWDRGLCAHGEIETGGIKNTRKCKLKQIAENYVDRTVAAAAL